MRYSAIALLPPAWTAPISRSAADVSKLDLGVAATNVTQGTYFAQCTGLALWHCSTRLRSVEVRSRACKPQIIGLMPHGRPLFKWAGIRLHMYPVASCQQAKAAVDPLCTAAAVTSGACRYVAVIVLHSDADLRYTPMSTGTEYHTETRLAITLSAHRSLASALVLLLSAVAAVAHLRPGRKRDCPLWTYCSQCLPGEG